MADERAAKQVGANGRFDGATATNGKIIEGEKGRSSGVEPTRKRSFLSDVGALGARASWHGLALAAILLLSAFLNLFWLSTEGYPIPTTPPP